MARRVDLRGGLSHLLLKKYNVPYDERYIWTGAGWTLTGSLRYRDRYPGAWPPAIVVADLRAIPGDYTIEFRITHQPLARLLSSM